MRLEKNTKDIIRSSLKKLLNIIFLTKSVCTKSVKWKQEILLSYCLSRTATFSKTKSTSCRHYQTASKKMLTKSFVERVLWQSFNRFMFSTAAKIAHIYLRNRSIFNKIPWLFASILIMALSNQFSRKIKKRLSNIKKLLRIEM